MQKLRARGRLVVVQEERFRLRRDDGRVLLLTLAHDATVDILDLERLERTGTLVDVSYEGQPNTESGVAHVVRSAAARA